MKFMGIPIETDNHERIGVARLATAPTLTPGSLSHEIGFNAGSCWPQALAVEQLTVAALAMLDLWDREYDPALVPEMKAAIEALRTEAEKARKWTP